MIDRRLFATLMFYHGRAWGMGHRVYNALHLTPYTVLNYLINSTVLFRDTVPFSFIPFM
jgi:hypothetical protein